MRCRSSASAEFFAEVDGDDDISAELPAPGDGHGVAESAVNEPAVTKLEWAVDLGVSDIDEGTMGHSRRMGASDSSTLMEPAVF